MGIPLALTALIATALSPLATGLAGGAGGDPMILPDYVRLQVVANSDSEYDQALKHSVRDAVCGALAGRVGVLETQEQAMALLAGKLSEVQDTVDRTMHSLGCSYAAEISLGQMDFPAKSYGGEVVPPGTYPALRVTLGEGHGRNWWCVVFPPLCFIDAGAGLATPPQSPGGLEGGQIKIEVKSWLRERLSSPVWQAVWEQIKAYLELSAAQ